MVRSSPVEHETSAHSIAVEISKPNDDETFSLPGIAFLIVACRELLSQNAFQPRRFFLTLDLYGLPYNA
jgi:hypothetical protein